MCGQRTCRRGHPDRVANRAALLGELALVFGDMTSRQALDLLVPNGIVAGSIDSYDRVENNPDVQAAGIFVDIAGDDGVSYRALRSPWHAAGVAASAPRRPAPRVGQHTGEIMAELGYAPASIAPLSRRGIVRTDLS
ncbi:CoA transferase [Pseudonocardia sp. KRD-291]|nr:CoA transferase [Pseudonocardia sp. KRD291]